MTCLAQEFGRLFITHTDNIGYLMLGTNGGHVSTMLVGAKHDHYRSHNDFIMLLEQCRTLLPYPKHEGD